MAQPEKKFRAGAITATVWKNTNKVDGKDFEFYTVAVERSFKDKEDKWKTTSSMRATDLPKVILVCQEAYKYLTLRDTEVAEGGD